MPSQQRFYEAIPKLHSEDYPLGSLEAELKDITILEELSIKVDKLVANRELASIVILSERSLQKFLSDEPDLYSVKDIKVRYE